MAKGTDSRGWVAGEVVGRANKGGGVGGELEVEVLVGWSFQVGGEL